MAVGKRLRVNFIDGVLTNALGGATTDTALESDGFAGLPAIDHAATGEYAAITIGKEIVHITTHLGGATAVTGQRAQEATSVSGHDAGAPWEHGPTELDYRESHEDLVTATISVTGYTIDVDYPVHDLTLASNVTFGFSAVEAGWAVSVTVVLRQDATGSRTVSWPASVQWNNATAPTLSTAANATDVLTFTTVNGGGVWFGFAAGIGMG